MTRKPRPSGPTYFRKRIESLLKQAQAANAQMQEHRTAAEKAQAELQAVAARLSEAQDVFKDMHPKEHAAYMAKVRKERKLPEVSDDEPEKATKKPTPPARKKATRKKAVRKRPRRKT